MVLVELVCCRCSLRNRLVHHWAPLCWRQMTPTLRPFIPIPPKTLISNKFVVSCMYTVQCNLLWTYFFQKNLLRIPIHAILQFSFFLFLHLNNVKSNICHSDTLKPSQIFTQPHLYWQSCRVTDPADIKNWQTPPTPTVFQIFMRKKYA